MKFELAHNELGDADEPEYHLASDLTELFTEVGLEMPRPIPVLRSDHQIAQKLHAVTGAQCERARDLVDLQLLTRGELLDLTQVTATCVRLLHYRRQQAWPPTIVPGADWDTLYAEAAEGLDVLATMDAAISWGNAFTVRLAEETPR